MLLRILLREMSRRACPPIVVDSNGGENPGHRGTVGSVTLETRGSKWVSKHVDTPDPGSCWRTGKLAGPCCWVHL